MEALAAGFMPNSSPPWPTNYSIRKTMGSHNQQERRFRRPAQKLPLSSQSAKNWTIPLRIRRPKPPGSSALDRAGNLSAAPRMSMRLGIPLSSRDRTRFRMGPRGAGIEFGLAHSIHHGSLCDARPRCWDIHPNDSRWRPENGASSLTGRRSKDH